MPITMTVWSKLSCVFCCLDTGVTDLFADVLCLCCYVLQETWRHTSTSLEDSCQLLTKDTQLQKTGDPRLHIRGLEL